MSDPTPPTTILIVDDSPGIIHNLGTLLESEYEVLFATRGAHALEIVAARAAEGRPVELILLDVVMPEMDGYEVCRRLKRDASTRDIPVIFLTVKGESDNETLGFELGAVDYVSKPFSSPVVRARVRTHLELKRKRDYFLRLTMVDGLTGVANRRRFDEALEGEWSRSRREHYPLSLLMIDVDHFKAYNDLFGHLEGDDCLRRVAQVLDTVTRRPGDLTARYGGEEFACLLPRTDGESARALAESCRAVVEAMAIPHRASSAGRVVTISIGAATLPADGDGSAERLLAEADDLLYGAKRAGRNRFLHEVL